MDRAVLLNMVDYRILSVSYDIALLSSRQAVLETAGYLVQSASDLQDAIELLRHREFQLVIVGQDLPEHHQYELVQKAKLAACKVLLLTIATEDTRLSADLNLDPYDGPYVLLEKVAGLLKRMPEKRPARSAVAGDEQQNLA